MGGCKSKEDRVIRPVNDARNSSNNSTASGRSAQSKRVRVGTFKL